MGSCTCAERGCADATRRVSGVRPSRRRAGGSESVQEWATACRAGGPGRPGPRGVCQRFKGGSALRRAATPRAYKGAAGEKLARNDSEPGRVTKEIRYWSA